MNGKQTGNCVILYFQDKQGEKYVGEIRIYTFIFKRKERRREWENTCGRMAVSMKVNLIMILLMDKALFGLVMALFIRESSRMAINMDSDINYLMMGFNKFMPGGIKDRLLKFLIIYLKI